MCARQKERYIEKGSKEHIIYRTQIKIDWQLYVCGVWHKEWKHSTHQNSNDALVFLLHHITNDLVIEIHYRLPGHPFPCILLLLLFQGELYKYLLQLLVAVVNTQLLETIDQGGT